MPAGALQIRVAANGDGVVASTLDGKLLRWDAAAFKKENADSPVVTLQLPIAGRALSISADGMRAVAGCDDGWLRHFDLVNGKELERHGPSVGAVLAAAWSPEAGRVISSSADKLLVRSRLGVVASFAPAKEAILAMSLSGDGSNLATVDASGKLIVSNVADGAATFEQVLPTKTVHRLAWSPDGKELAVASGDGPFLLAIPETPAR
jgi:WD40 repeat protein